jgi:hypothetical protein
MPALLGGSVVVTSPTSLTHSHASTAVSSNKFDNHVEWSNWAHQSRDFFND